MPTRLVEADTKEEAIELFKAKYKELKEDKKTLKRKTKFVLYSQRGKEGVWIGKKVGSGYLDLKKFDNREDARKFLNENYDDLLDILEKVKYIPNERRATNNQRVGIDRRNGKDTSPEMFTEAFGFRGVEFGNWVKLSGERQELLNKAYDSLMDLAEILGIPSKAISLNGELGLAFGSRGIKGASAHYEPGKVVINLTRMSGAGSLAHEWFHALDNFFSRMRGERGEFLTEKPRTIMSVVEGEYIRPEMVEAFKGIVDALSETRIVERSAHLDERRTKKYWGTIREITARVFENYTIHKLVDILYLFRKPVGAMIQFFIAKFLGRIPTSKSPNRAILHCTFLYRQNSRRHICH